MIMERMPSISTLHLFSKLDQLLIQLLKSLSPADWQRTSAAPLWTIKDVAAHLLDGNVRTLSISRDGYFGARPEPINSYQELVGYLNRLNADWVSAMQRVSPALLIDLLEDTGRQYNAYLTTLDANAPAIFPVAWAGEEVSPNWFHIAREYTEKWHHQQQIRLVLGQEGALFEPSLYLPYLETSMRALPHHYRDQPGQKGEVIKFMVPGVSGGEWWLQFKGDKWEMGNFSDVLPATEVQIPPAIAWRIFSKNIPVEEARKQVQIIGNQTLGQYFLHMVAVMA